MRASAASVVVMVRWRTSVLLAAICWRRSMSRVMREDLVMMPMRRPFWRAKTSRRERVMPTRRSIGWYGSVAVPIAISSWFFARLGASLRSYCSRSQAAFSFR